MRRHCCRGPWRKHVFCASRKRRNDLSWKLRFGRRPSTLCARSAARASWRCSVVTVLIARMREGTSSSPASFHTPMNAPNIFVCAPYAAANSPRETAARELPAPHSTSHHRASIELGDASTSERMDRSSEGENVDAVEVEGERTESDADTPSASPVVRECRSEAILRWRKK